MALERSIKAMYDRVRELEQALDNLLWAVVQGQPAAEQGHSLVDFHEASATELLGAIRTAREIMTERLRTTLDLAAARTLTLLAHERCLQTGQRFLQDWASYERRHELQEIAAQRQHQWASWACGVLDAMDVCAGPLYELQHALLVCWQDVTDIGVSAAETLKQQQIESVPTPIRLVSERPASNQ